jgi:tRNA-dihydrouridine synthase
MNSQRSADRPGTTTPSTTPLDPESAVGRGAGSESAESTGPVSISKDPLSPPLILAPLATLSHAALRLLIEELGGCDLYYNEMISAAAYLAGASFESYYLQTHPDPSRLVHQIVGYNEEEIDACAQQLAAVGVFGIDINMGCSAPPIVRKGGGIAWMRDRSRAALLVRRLRASLPGTRLSVKLRLGDRDDINRLVEFARALQDAGLDYLTLHPKTRKEGEQRPARWDRIAKLQQSLTIPVIGNGNVVDSASYERKVEQASPSAVMIGRAAAQKPWIFAEIKRSRDAGRADRGTGDTTGGAAGDTGGTLDLRAVDHRFRELLQELQPREFWPTRAKRFYRYYSTNFRFGYRLGAQIQNLRSYGEMKDLMDRYYDDHQDEIEIALN